MSTACDVGNRQDSSGQEIRVSAAGWKPGTYEIQAYAGGLKIGAEPFDVAFETNDGVEPNLWVEGDSRTALTPYAEDPNKEGRGYAPNPQIGERVVLVIPVEFTDAQFDPSLDLDTYLHEAFDDGRPHPHNSGNVSLVSYWLEMSGERMKFRPFIQKTVVLDRRTPFTSNVREITQQAVSELGVRGLAQGYADGFTHQDWGSVDSIAFVFPGKRFDQNKPEICDGLDNDGDGLADEDANCTPGPPVAICGDGLISPGEPCDTGTPDDKFDDGCDGTEAPDPENPGETKLVCRYNNIQVVWPAGFTQTLMLPNDTSKTLPLVRLDMLWAEQQGLQNREGFVSVTIHEFGHVLGLRDHYKRLAPTLGLLDVMAHQSTFAGLNLSDRMRLGWVDPEQVPLMDNSSPFSQAYDISPLNPGQFKNDVLGVEFLLASGHSIFWSMRTRLQDAIGDQYFNVDRPEASFYSDPTEKLFLGTDSIANPTNTSISRASVILAPADPTLSGTGSNLSRVQAGETWHMHDLNNFMILSVEPINVTSTSATLNLEYHVADPARIPGPDLNILPWPSGSARYQSPDIEVRSPAWIANREEAKANIPEINVENTVVVTVHNSTDITAQDVNVSLYAVPFGTGATELQYDLLGTTIIDEVPANGQATAEFIWAPDGSYDHVCLKAEIAQNNIHDDTSNNVAKSNYVGLSSGSSSPADLNKFTLTITNPFDQAVLGHPVITVDSGRFRAFMDRRTVDLDVGESQRISVRYHFIGDFAAEFGETLFGVPQTNIDMTAEFDVPDGADHLSVPSLEGATARIRTGFKTYVTVDRIPSVNPNEPIEFPGHVARVTDDSPVPDGGRLLACIWRGDSIADECEQVEVGGGGEWNWTTFGPWTKARFHFITNDEDLESPHVEVQP